MYGVWSGGTLIAGGKFEVGTMQVEIERLLVGIVQFVIEPGTTVPDFRQGDRPAVLEIALAARAEDRGVCLGRGQHHCGESKH
jgi:hypothetical protein